MTSDFARRTGREENTAWNTASPGTRTTPASARHAGDDDLGRRVRDGLTAAVGEHRIARLLGTRAAIRCADDAVEVCLPDRFSAEIVERNLGEALRQAADQVIPGRDIRVRVDEQLADAPANRAADSANPPGSPPRGPTTPAGRGGPGGQGPKRTPVPPFLVGAANRVAHEAVRRAACEPDASDLVFVHGPCGVGKTHLLRHAAGLCRRQRPNARIRVTSGELFISGYINAIKNSTVDEFQKRHRKLDLLVVDDVHVIAGKDGTQQELIRTLNDLLMTGARVVLASDAHPRDIAKLHAALSSRLVSGVVAPIGRPDADLVRRLVPALAKRRGIVLDPKGQDILIHRILEDRDATVRDIEGTLTQIQAMASLLDRDRGLFLTAEHVRQAVEMRAGERPGIRPGPISIEKIIDTVCRELAVTRDDLSGKGRAKKVVLARELIVHLGKRHTGRSYPELAMAIGRPNHSTVITAHQRFQQRVKAEDPVAVGATFDGTTAGELTMRMERAMGI